MNAMGESFLNGRVVLHPGNCLDVLARLEECSVDSCVTDPPYHLTSIVQRFGGEDRKAWEAINGNHGGGVSPYSRTSVGFMGKVWDGGDVAFRPDTWRAVFRVLKPGAHLVACGGTRTYHRLACAIEDAGFEIRDTISWLYGSGFPKSHDVSKGIDRAAGAERPIIGERELWGSAATGGRAGQYANGEAPKADGSRKPLALTTSATDAARQWQGWGTALKPACELIVLARKPLSEGTVAANVLRWGTGAINVDACRVEGEKPDTTRGAGGQNGRYGPIGAQGRIIDDGRGRWPANVAHDGSDEVTAAFPDVQSNDAKGAWGRGNGEIYGTLSPRPQVDIGRGDTGSAARFFFQAKQDHRCQLCDAHIVDANSATENIQTVSSVRSDALDLRSRESAASARQSSDPANDAASHSPPCHPQNSTSVPLNAEPWPLARIVQNVSDAADLCNSCATVIARGLAGVRQTGCAVPLRFTCSIGDYKETILSRSLASYVAHRENTDTILTTTNLRELFGCVFYAIAASTNSERVGSEASTKPVTRRLWYSSKADADDRLGSKHPTVKPLDLMQWLVRLVTPKGGTVLDPFAGTGTTGEAAWREGMRAMLIEAEAEYQADIRRRMALVLAGPDERARESIKAKNLPVDYGPLFGFPEAAE